jgi:Domain of unknown function (DUF4135)
VITAPFTELACERFVAAAATEGLDEAVDLAALRSGLAHSPARRLVSLASRTLVLELNVLRVTGKLTGATPQQRFWSFVRHLSRRAGLTALLEEYPVLARLLAQATVQAAEFWLELLRRFAANRARIVADVLGGVDPGRLVELAGERGDAHRRGRSVAVLRFEAWSSPPTAHARTGPAWNGTTGARARCWPCSTRSRVRTSTTRTSSPAPISRCWWTWRRCCIHRFRPPARTW